MAEYEGRERRISTQLSDVLGAFCRQTVDAHHNMQLRYAEYIQYLAKLDNIKWAIDIGILTLDQALSILISIPVVGAANVSQVGIEEAELNMEFAVSAHADSDESLRSQTKAEGSVKIGGVAAAFGAGGSMSVSADTTYQKGERRASDYSSTVKMRVLIKRKDPPEGVSILMAETADVIKKAMSINKAIIERQCESLALEQQNTPPPADASEAIPESEPESEHEHEHDPDPEVPAS